MKQPDQLTPGFLRKIQPERGRATKSIPDGKTGGLAARYGARGRIEFTLQYYVFGHPDQQRRHIGFWWDDELRGDPPSDRWLTLAQARIKADTIKEKAHHGEGYEWRAGRAAPKVQPAVPNAVGAVLEEYELRHLRTLKRGGDQYRTLQRVLHPLRSRPIAEITRADIRAQLDKIIARGTGYAANRTHDYLRAFFSWAADRELVTVSPMADMKPPMAKEESRERVLSKSELAAVWHAVDALHAPRRDAIRVLMLTGARRSEVAEMKWDEVTGNTWTLPGSRAKNSQRHVVHLSPLAADIINAQPRTCPYVFSYSRGRPVGDLSTYVAKLARTMDIPHWQLHDLRRSMASGMQDLGIEPHVIDACLGHSNVIKGIAAVYLRGKYRDERRAAMELWGAHIAALTSIRIDT
jgi:integrase